MTSPIYSDEEKYVPPGRITEDVGIKALRGIQSNAEDAVEIYIKMRTTISTQQRRIESLERANHKLSADRARLERRIGEQESELLARHRQTGELRKRAIIEREADNWREPVNSKLLDQLARWGEDHGIPAPRGWKIVGDMLDDEEGDYTMIETKVLARWSRLAVGIFNRIMDGHQKLAIIMAELLVEEIKEEWDGLDRDVEDIGEARREPPSEDNESTQSDMFD